MSIDRGPDWMPTDGSQDRRPVVKCSACGVYANCYRGPLLKVVENERGVWETYFWTCASCMAELVGAALRNHPPPDAA